MIAQLWISLTIFLAASVQAIDVTRDVFGTFNEYQPLAFGDFNADRLTDMFVIQNVNGSSVIKVLLSNDIPPYFTPTGPGPSCSFKENEVKSAVPSDFDGDGSMDLMVLLYKKKENAYKAHILWGNLKSLECLEEEVSIASFKSQPLLMDFNGDMIADLFGEDLNGNRSFWVFSQERSKPIQVPMTNPYEERLPSLRLSGGHGFVDLDDDLAADLWVASEGRFELWSSSQSYASFISIDYPEKANNKPFSVVGTSSFLDIDLDGSMEVLLPVCSDNGCAQSFLYVCDFSNASQEWQNLKVNFKDDKDVTWSFPSERASYLYTNTITPRIGDINLDGFPDILMTVFHKNKPQVILLINTECTVDCDYPRTFVPQWNTFDAWPNSVLGTFFDFEEDGNLDVLLVNSSSDGSKYTVGAYKDASEYDAMFIKILVLTGQCYENCANGNIPYGTNQPGPTVTYSITSATGTEQKSCATQLTQSSHFALQLPFTIFGLSRNWNFVDKLIIGLPIREANLSNSNEVVLKAQFTQIIPNSQLKVIPYPIGEPEQWITKLFITPSKAMLLTAGSLVATCLFVAAIIGGLHYREKQEDKRERRQEAQKFHFDAM